MTIILLTSIVFIMLAYFLSKPIRKYKYILYGITAIISLILSEEANILSLGYVPLGIFLVVMFSSVIENSVIKKRLLMVRAEFSVIGGLTLVPHALGFLGFLLEDYKGPLFLFILFGIFSAIVMIPLWITSFTFIRKRMGYPLWKKLHQLSYIFYLSVMLHLILMKNERFWIYITILIVYIVLKAPEVYKKRKSAK